jgi:cytochrome b561
MDSQKLFNLHRQIMLFAFYILLPIGISIPLFFRKQIGQNWYAYHKHIMISVSILSFIGIMISLYTKDNEPEKNINSMSTRHGILGILLVILIILNIGWAIIIRRYINDENSKLTRKNWLYGHRIFATLIVIGLIYNLSLGKQIYNQRFYKLK